VQDRQSIYDKIVVEMGPLPLSKNHMKTLPPTKRMKMSNECVDTPGTPGPSLTQPYCEPEERPTPDRRTFPHLHSLFDKLEQTFRDVDIGPLRLTKNLQKYLDNPMPEEHSQRIMPEFPADCSHSQSVVVE